MCGEEGGKLDTHASTRDNTLLLRPVEDSTSAYALKSASYSVRE